MEVSKVENVLLDRFWSAFFGCYNSLVICATELGYARLAAALGCNRGLLDVVGRRKDPAYQRSRWNRASVESGAAGRASEEVLAKHASRTTEVKESDLLAYAQSHKGTAEYFVVASFADAWAGPRRLRVVDAAGPMVAEIRAPLVLPAQQAVQSPTAAEFLTASFA